MIDESARRKILALQGRLREQQVAIALLRQHIALISKVLNIGLLGSEGD